MEKPALGREGANIRILHDGRVEASTDGSYDGGAIISQRRAPMLMQDGWTTVIGSWIAHEKACGIIFRESRDAVVRETSRVLPHLFR